MKIDGYSFSAKSVGFKKNGKLDAGIMLSEKPLRVSAVFTKNKIKAAPVIISKRNSGNIIKALAVNSGNANACNGKDGFKAAGDILSALAAEANISAENILVCSTGVIGEKLDPGLFKKFIPEMVSSASPVNIEDFARCIMTTDTFPKIVEKKIFKKYKIIGIAKGSGMIMPDMATMLAFIFTDLPVKKEIADKIFRECVDASFNSITVDGDTSTNDTAAFFYPDISAFSGNFTVAGEGENYEILKSTLFEVCLGLSEMLVKDGEGATKAVKISVINAYTRPGAKKIAFTVANSPLFKTMLTGEDLNWGRIIAAVGRANVRIRPDAIDIYVQDKLVVKNSVSSGLIDKETEETVLSPDKINIKIDLNAGKESFDVLTCNLTKEYVDINGSYRS